MRQILEVLTDFLPSKALSDIDQDGVIKAAKKAVIFNFGDMTRIPEQESRHLVSYGSQLFTHNLFELPFPTVCFTSIVNRGTLHTIVERNALTSELILFSVFVAPTSEVAAILSTMVSVVPEITTEEVALKYIMHYSALKVKEDEIGEMAKELMYEVFEQYAILNAHGVETTLNTPNARMNKKRVARGQVELMPSHEVFIRCDGKKYKANGVAENETQHHRRIHWRRGHVRRLPNGNLTNVRPCLIGKAHLGTTLPEKPSYQIAV